MLVRLVIERFGLCHVNSNAPIHVLAGSPARTRTGAHGSGTRCTESTAVHDLPSAPEHEVPSSTGVRAE